MPLFGLVLIVVSGLGVAHPEVVERIRTELDALFAGVFDRRVAKGSTPYASESSGLKPWQRTYQRDSQTPTPVPISHGVIKWPYEDTYAPLEIITSPGANYFIKVVDLSGRTILTAYIVGGRRFETSMPLGTYRLRYASGKVWYGEGKLFGPDTIYSEAKTDFRFSFDGRSYSGFTVELIRQVGGNLPTRRIDPSTF